MKSNKPYSFEDNPHKGNVGLTRIWLAAGNSWSGLKFAYSEESAFRQELGLFLILLPIIILLDFTTVERVLLFATLILVLVVELLNSGLEAAIDRISFENHALSKRAKDLGSAAVMVSLFSCIFCWVLVLISYCQR